MTLTLTDLAKFKADQANKSLQIVLDIDGVDEYFGSAIILKTIKVGDPGLLIGDDWKIGGLRQDENQNADPLIQLEGSTNTITQQLEPDRAIGSSISQMEIALIDQDDNAITRLITPGEVVLDILGRKCKVWMGFQDTAFKRDYVLIFRGLIAEINSDPKLIKFLIAHPDEKKRQQIFDTKSTELAADLTSVFTGDVSVVSSSNFLSPVVGPSGSIDTSIKYYLQINDEIMRYTTVGVNTINVTERGALNTTAAAHVTGDSVNSFYTLEGNAIDLALKLMLSGTNGYWASSVDVTHIEYISPTLTISNAVFFDGVLVDVEYGVSVGDYVTVTGSAYGSNNVFHKQILEIVTYESDSSYIVLDGVTFVEDKNTAATVSFRSQYDTLGVGLKMHGDEVDVATHLKIQSYFLSDFSYKFYLSEDINGREFLDEQIYKPAGCYSLPRNAQASVGYHSPPIPGSNTPVLNVNTLKAPSKIRLRRSLYRNFYNTILYQFDVLPTEEKYMKAVIHTDGESLTDIPVGNRALVIKSKGMRSSLSGEAKADIFSERRLNRYKRGAEHMSQLKIMFGAGFSIEVGDVVLFDGTGLNISNTTNGDRSYGPKLVEVVNRSFSIRTGEVTLDVVDTNFDAAARYGLISPSSVVQTAISTTTFVIGASFSAKYGANEWRKWQQWEGIAVVRLRSSDYATSGTAVLKKASSNTIELEMALAFTPAAGYVMEMAPYDEQVDQINLLYAAMRDTDFGDGKPQFQML